MSASSDITMELLNRRSVDTICRDSADTQCMIIQKTLKTSQMVNLKPLSTLTYHSSLRQGQSLSSIVDSVFGQSLVSDSTANTAYIY